MSNSVLVTGGSGALGSAIVRRFCSENRKVAFTYRKGLSSAEKLAKEMKKCFTKCEGVDVVIAPPTVYLEKFVIGR